MHLYMHASSMHNGKYRYMRIRLTVHQHLNYRNKNMHGETHYERLQHVTLLSDLLATKVYTTAQ